MDEQTLNLEAAERDLVRAVVDEIRSCSGGDDPRPTVDRAAASADRLPLRLRQFLSAVRRAETAVSVIRGLPVDPGLAPTPPSWQEAAHSGAGAAEEITLLLCGSVLGDVVGWRLQQQGRLVHDICPARGLEQSFTSASSELTLSLHTEDAFHARRCDYVALSCLRNPDRVSTTLAEVSVLRLAPETEAVLREARFTFRPDDSHTVRAGRGDARGAVIFGPPEQPYLRYDPDFMTTDDHEAAQALKTLSYELSAVSGSVVLEPGDLAFVDNYQVVHGRSSFVPRYDGHDRWLKRITIARDIRTVYMHTGRRNRIIAV